jgi:uncharacterized protein (TIGR03437 family)
MLILMAASLPAQVTGWRQIGGTAVEASLASPVTGPVDRVWFSASGSDLYARTASGIVYLSRDFETWTRASAEAPAPETAPAVSRTPAHQAALKIDPRNRSRMYALGPQIFRSDDAGRSWTSLTSTGPESLIGPNQRDLAISPVNSDFLVVANDFGVWRTMDGGRSWSGMNDTLPNLSIRRILGLPQGASGLRIWNPQLGPLERIPGIGDFWIPAEDGGFEQEIEMRAALSARLQVPISALAAARDWQYAGSVDGRIWASSDRGRTWTEAPSRWAGAVEAIALETDEPRIAVAALASAKGTRVLRTINAGLFWDDVSGNLPEGAVHGVAFDRGGRALYAATDKGVFVTRLDLDAAGPAGNWIALEGLPISAALDVKLDASHTQLYVALDGPGLFAGPAPHRRNQFRWVNAADFSNRPAAPGSLLSVIGGRVSSARAGGRSVPLLASSDQEAQVQVPFEAAGDSLSMDLETRERRVTLPIPMREVSPAIFVDTEGTPMALDAETGVLLDAANPARPGMRVQILATGLGRVNPDWPTGLEAPLENPPAVRAAVTVMLDQVELRVRRATLAPGYIGFYLIEVEIPAIVNSGPAELLVRSGGQESNRVRLYLGQ